MSGWLLDEWSRFIQLLRVHNPEYKFVFIGAEYDLGLSDELMKLFPKEIYINAMNQSLGVTIEILKRLEMFVGFQSGLSIINETIGAKQTVMLYSPKLAAMIETWPDKKRIESGAYKGCTFGNERNPLRPEDLFGWLKENEKI
jgi:ADP-heptose:LPS heptosyltransferase